MKVGIIAGSHRIESQSAKVANFVKNRIGVVVGEGESYLLDLGKTPFCGTNQNGRTGVL